MKNEIYNYFQLKDKIETNKNFGTKINHGIIMIIVV